MGTGTTLLLVSTPLLTHVVTMESKWSSQSLYIYVAPVGYVSKQKNIGMSSESSTLKGHPNYCATLKLPVMLLFLIHLNMSKESYWEFGGKMWCN